MVNYTYNRKKSRARIRPRSIEKIRGSKLNLVSLCKNDQPENVTGNVLEQLEETYYTNSIKSYPGTLIVIVGNSAKKLSDTLGLYYSCKPDRPHDVILIFNGQNVHELSEFIPEVPDNCICEPIVMKNWGWDFGMYYEAVTRFKYDSYFFLNDDVIKVEGNTWLDEFHQLLNADCGFVGVQGHHFIRTSYYGATRLFWLTMATAILSNCIEFSAYRLKRLLPRIKRVGAIDAFCFEATSKFFADRCGFRIGWLSNPHQFSDRNCIRYSGVCATQNLNKPAPYFIDKLGNGLEERISVDYVINWARQHGLREIR